MIQGIMEFRRSRREGMRELFATLALGQKPDCLFIACSDSRVAANVFASTDPGDLFVIRNLGNIMPPFPDGGSAVAALEFALESLKVSHIVVCGHSDCGAMLALTRSHESPGNTPLAKWLRHAQAADVPEDGHNQDFLSQRNVSVQLENLRSHPMVREREASGSLKLHGLWFNIRHAEVHYLENAPKNFVLIDDKEGAAILDRL
ncbi:MAG TPA: carbonic anhydrase [bacterium]|nr:carbonic anhydrase [bacterium]